MTDSPRVPAGWYPDGSGAHRYYDGQAWTEHVHTDAPVAPIAVAPTVLPTRHGRASPRRPRVIAGAAAIALVLAAGSFAALSAGDDEDPSRSATPSSATVRPANTSPVTFGASPAVVASVARCTDVSAAEDSDATSIATYQRVTCLVGTTTVEVTTYPSEADQLVGESAVSAAVGDGKYARGEGWVAKDDASSAATAEAFAKALAGTVNGAGADWSAAAPPPA